MNGSGKCSTCGINFDEMTEPCDACGFGDVNMEAMNPHKSLDFHLDEDRLNEIQPEENENDDND